MASDVDEDGVPDFADDDNDGDGILDTWEMMESCDQVDHDGDGTPDFMDIDSDGDGVANINDPWPLDEASSSDMDGDGTPDNLDYDIDGDSWINELEKQLGLNPLDPNDTKSSQLVDMVTGLPNVAPSLKDVPDALEGSSSNITGDIKVSIDGDTNEDNHFLKLF